jgi:uncharacterized membrane protein
MQEQNIKIVSEEMSGPATSATAMSCRPYEGFVSKAGVVILPCIFLVIWLTVVIFLIVMFYRLVRAVEKIAAKIETGVPVKKQDSSNMDESRL